MRATRSLAGMWAFQPDPDGVLTLDTLAPSQTIPVPMPWQAAFPEMKQYSGYAWYQQTFDLDEGWLEGEVLLHFGAVDYWCQVYVNGQLAGEHEGGFTPFVFPIRNVVQAGQNTVSVRVYDVAQSAITIPRWQDRPQNGTQPPFDPREIPHGKQEWYLNVGGLWQDVTLTAVASTYISQVHVTPNIHTGEAQVRVRLEGSGLYYEGKVQVRIGGQTAEAPLQGGQSEYTLTIRVDNMQLWTLDSPHLYTAEVTLSNGKVHDQVNTRFGFREITTRNGQLIFNGEPLYLLSALDQDLYPDTIYTVPSDDYLRDQFAKAKAMGLNNLRCHIKPPDPRYLDIADEMGLLIWAEIPSWRTFAIKTNAHPELIELDPLVKARARRILEEMIDRDYNHPSIIVWTIVNEDWGTALAFSEDHRAWVAEMYDLAKRLDPTRLVVDNSPCPAPWGLSTHVKTDLDDFHVYANIPDRADSFEQFAEQFGLRPSWSFSSHGDSQRTGHEPLILSEFGNWGLPSLRNIAPNGEPHWFDLGGWWNPFDGEPGYPTGVLDRFTGFGLNRIWSDYEAFAEATQWHQFWAMKFEIEALRRQPGISGYVITEFTDAYWESNGLLDFHRCPKVYHERLRDLNSPDMVVAKLNRYAYWDDQTVQAQVYLSHFSRGTWQNVTLKTVVDTTAAQIQAPVMEPGQVAALGRQRWTLPTVERATVVPLEFYASDAQGAPLVESETPLLVLPASARQAAYTAPVAVMMQVDRSTEMPLGLDGASPNSGVESTEPTVSDELAESSLYALEYRMRQLGYQTRRQLTADTRLLVTDSPTAEILEWVRQGGDMLLLTAGSNPFFWEQGRGGTYGGNWMTCWSWIAPDAHQRLKDVSNPLTLPFIDLMPLTTLVDLPFENPAYQGDILAGQITGWLRHPAAHTIQFRYGQGRVVVTTFRIKHTLQYHPVAVAMLHDLIDHLTSDRCQPTLSL